MFTGRPRARYLDLVSPVVGPQRVHLTHGEWASVLTHPRLVGSWDSGMEAVVRLYLKAGRPFTVVLRPDPAPNE